jgi:predicted DNA-binding transcriptional regulator AlpA
VAVFWRPEMLPTIVLLQPAPDSFFGAEPLDLAQLGAARAERVGRDGRYVIVRHDVGELRLCLRDATPNQPLAIIMPLDDDLPTRAEAALRLWRRIGGRAAGQPLALTRQRRDRLMPDPLAGLPPRFLRTPEAARFLGLSGRTLEKHRTYGTGPTYRKIGGRVVYALDDLKAWADRGAKTSTSDPGPGTVYPAKRGALPAQAAVHPYRR